MFILTNPSITYPKTDAAERYPLRRAAVYRKRAAECTHRAELDAEAKAAYQHLARDYEGLADDMDGAYADRVWKHLVERTPNLAENARTMASSFGLNG
jgi:hypothetical protein